MRVAVLSDLHIHRHIDEGSWELAGSAFLVASKYDHVVIAGDLFDSASAFERDGDAVRRRLKRLGLWAPDRLTITVGNHDIFHTSHRGPPAERAMEVVQALGTDANATYEDLVARPTVLGCLHRSGSWPCDSGVRGRGGGLC